MHSLVEQLRGFGARHPVPADAPFLAALYASTRGDLLGDGSADPVFAAQLIAMQQRLQTRDYAARFPTAEVVLLEHAGLPFARLVVHTNAARIRLVDIALLPAARGRGLGGRILQALQQWARRRALPLSLAVHPGNHGARRLYAGLGFLAIDGDGVDGAACELVWHPF